MPTWRNDSDIDKFFPRTLEKAAPGGIIKTKFYPYPRPDKFSLVSHLPKGRRPWEKVFVGKPPIALPSGLAKYDRLEVVNRSGGDIFVIVNEDVDHDLLMSHMDRRVIGPGALVDAIEIPTEAQGPVYIYGVPAAEE